jgi:hypothetical protein
MDKRSLCGVGEVDAIALWSGAMPWFGVVAQRLLLQPSIAHLQLR